MGKLVEAGTLGLVDEGDLTGENAANAATAASTRAAEIRAQGQRESLDYLKEREALPRQFSEGALTQLAGLYGLPGGEGNQQQFIDSAMQSPLYKQLMGNQAFGEEAILRNASATGGLRSGNTNVDLSEYNTRLANEALTTAYNQQLQGITGLANLPSNANAISQAIAAPSITTSQGIVAGAQAQQQQQQSFMNNLFGLGGAGLVAMSDIRLKHKIKHVGERNGHAWFEWEWRPEAEKIGLSGKSEGVMAHFVYETDPDAVDVIDGLLCVDYGRLGLTERVH